jgi:ABC-type antimicrobial peptide transport system ATPase subunit
MWNLSAGPFIFKQKYNPLAGSVYVIAKIVSGYNDEPRCSCILQNCFKMGRTRLMN